MVPTPLIQEGYDRAVDLLKQNISELGFSASTVREENYYSVWSRDHAITAIGAYLTGEKDLINTAKKGVLTLLRHQKDHGQLPSYIEIENKKKVYGGLGSITSVDSNMWIVIAAAELYKHTKDRRFISQVNLRRYSAIYRLLKAFDSNDCGLLEVPRASDWADVFNRSYHVLYDECLYYQTLDALIYLFTEGYRHITNEEEKKNALKRIRWIRRRKPKVKRRINEQFWFTKEKIPRILEEYMIYDPIVPEDYSYYQSHLVPFKIYWHNRIETFGNVLAILTKIADKKKSKTIIDYILKNEINKPFPLKALHPPVHKHHNDWQPIYRFKEQPHKYHNGGIWPVIAGFWIHALVKNDRRNIAKKELKTLAQTLQSQGWQFHEYMHGKTGEPFGKSGQAWSGAAYIFAYHSVYHPKTTCFTYPRHKV